MSSRIDLGFAELTQLGSLISRANQGDYSERLIMFLNGLVAHDSSLFLVYYRDRRPKLLFDGLKNPQRRNSVASYLEAAYLLDPFYQEALRRSQPTLLRFSDIGEHDASLEAYFSSYYRQSAVADEVNFIVPLAPNRTAALSIERDANHQGFTDDELRRLELLVPLIGGLILKFFTDRPADQGPDDYAHERLRHRLSQFRSDVLTRRERDVMELMLKGQSVAQIAGFLAISIETARVHRRNIYAKLSISSLAELFALAFDWVTDHAG